MNRNFDIIHSYIERGSGEPLILLHGNGENCGYFIHQINYFSQHYRVIAPDTRGHGLTPRGTAPFTIRQFADDLNEFMNRLNIEKAHLLGFSDGANIAMLFASKYPDKVNKLILNGGNLSPKGVKSSVQFPIYIGYKIASFFSKRDPKAKKNAEMLGLMVNDPNIDPLALLEIKQPTLIIAGTKDMIKESESKLIHASIHNSTLIILKGDHFIASGQHKAFNEAVFDFLKE